MASVQTSSIVKKPGPPVPPRPQHATTSTLIATTLRTQANQRNTQSRTLTSFANTTQQQQQQQQQQQSANPNNTSVLSSLTVNTIEQQQQQQQHTNNINNKQNPPIIHKKPIVTRQTSNGGRTVIYKSPTISAQQRQEQNTNTISVSMRTTKTTINNAPKPPLKLRKAPDVPKIQQQQQQQQQSVKELPNANVVNLNRHNSMGCTSSPKTIVTLKETRLSLGRADLDKFGKIQLNQLQLSSQPLPKPRKIVQMPVATMDVEEQRTSNNNSLNVASVANIFRRSKTTLDNIAARNAAVNGTANISSPNRFLSGKTVEIKNNLKNAAERLFSEIIVNQHNKHAAEPAPTIITKHERALQYQPKALSTNMNTVTVAVNTTPSKVNIISNNCTRISINGTNTSNNTVVAKNAPIDGMLNSPEKKQTFHEILISELAAMRTKSNSMENLQTKDTVSLKDETETRLRCNSVEEFEEEEEDEQDALDHEDVDADNIEDAEGDEEFMRKTFKLSSKNSSRKRCASGCSSDSSPYGTERSARIRTSDWIEVQDNGKPVTLTSCHISLEDSGLEDEERLDDVSTSGVGDSWDSVRETQKEQRCRNTNRGMSINDLPPLPKSLSGINKMLGSDSGLLSDADVTSVDNNNLSASIKSTINNSNDSNQLEYQKENIDVNHSDYSCNNNMNNTNIVENNRKNFKQITTVMADTNDNANNINIITDNDKMMSKNKTSNTKQAVTITGSILDTQLATLKKEMYGLRQLDLSLLNQLWALNDSIQEFRTMLQEQEQEQQENEADIEQERDCCVPHSTGPSSYDSGSSEGEEDVITAKRNLGAIPKIITSQPKLTQTISIDQTQASSTVTTASKPLRPPLPKALETKPPVPRMRSAPPPPPVNRKIAPPRPT